MTANDKPIVAAENVTHTYKTVRALKDVTLTIPAGRMVGLLGPDGVGKSTLLGLIAGARKLQTGSLRALGGDMSSSRHRADGGPRIAYMPQGLGKNLYQELSVSENLDFFGKLKQHRIQLRKRLGKGTDFITSIKRQCSHHIRK